MKCFHLILPSLACMASMALSAPTQIKWVCIGNSITAGYPQANLTYVNGTTRLSGLIGPQDTIENDGVSGATLLKKGDNPYWSQGKFAHIFSFKPDIISIELGTNDTKPANWTHSADFVADLTAMVDTLTNNINPKPDIWLMLPPPIFSNTYGINDSIMTNGVIPRIKQVATAKGLKLLDANTPLRSHSSYFSDGVHFTATGADSLASVVYQSFISQVTRIACVGNSITFGATVNPPQAYPVRLNMLLGRGYYVRNEGYSGATLKKNGSLPYWTTSQFKDVFRFQPNIITIALGTNDSRPKEWNTATFISDYKALLDTFSNAIAPKPKFELLKPMPAWMLNGAWNFDNNIAGNGISGLTIRDSVIPAIQQVADQKVWPTIDLYTPMLMGKAYTASTTPSWAPDGVHPNALGQDTLAAVIYRAFTAPVSVAPGMGKASTDTRMLPGSALGSESYSADGRTVIDPVPASGILRKRKAPPQGTASPR